MNDTGAVTVDDRAWIGWTKLPPAVQADILSRLAPLAGQPAEEWARAGVQRWPSDGLYVLPTRVGPDELLVFFYARCGQIHIDSMLLKEAFDRRARTNGAAPA